MAIFTAKQNTWDFPESVDYDDFALDPQSTHALHANNGDAIDACWDGTFFYVVDFDNDVYKYNSAWVYQSTHNLHANNTTTWGITWDGTFFYVINQLTKLIYKYNSAWVYQSTHALHADNGNGVGMCWDGTYFYIVEKNDDKVYKYNSAWVFQSTYNVIDEPSGIDWDGTYFYITDNVDYKTYRYDADWNLQSEIYDTTPILTNNVYGIVYNNTTFYLIDAAGNEAHRVGLGNTIKTISGHLDSIILYDEMYESWAAAHMTGNVEYWLRAKDAADKVEVVLEDATGNHCINISINTDKIIGDGTDALNPALDFIWYLIRVDFNCTANTYDLYVNNVKKLTAQAFGVNNDGSGLTRLSINVDTDENGLIDGVGYDWDVDYDQGDNADDTIDVTDNIIWCKIVEEIGKPSYADMQILASSVDYFEGGHKVEFFDSDVTSSWSGIILYPESIIEGTSMVGNLKLIGLDSAFSNVYKKNFTTARDSEYILKNIIDNALTKEHSYDDEIDNFTITYKYDLKSKILKFFNYQRMLERAIIHYKPDGEIFFNKYNNLSKNPQIYPATYDFEDEAVGTSGTDISLLDNCQAGSAAEIIALYEGHKKVVKMTATGATAIWHYVEDPAIISGTVEFYMKSVVGTTCYRMRDSLSNIMLYVYYYAAGNVRVTYGDGAGGNTTTAPYNITTDFPRFKIQFNCTTDKFSVWCEEVLLVDDENFALDLDADYANRMRWYFGAAGECYVDAYGESWDANYDVGDNLTPTPWDADTGKIIVTNYTPNANRHVTRAPVIGANNDLGQVYYVGRATEDEEDEFGIVELQTWRDPEITNYTEAKQIGDNLQTIYSTNTQMISLIVFSKKHVQVGYTVELEWSGAYSITKDDFLVTKRIWYPINDMCEIELTDNILTREAFNITVENKDYDEDAQQSFEEPDTTESTVDGTVVPLLSVAALRAYFPIGIIRMFSGTWVNNVTIRGWYKCDGNNGTPNLIDKFIRGAATSGGSGGSDDAVVVSHGHTININLATGVDQHMRVTNYQGGSPSSTHTENAGEPGTNKNIPVYYELIFIMRVS